MYKAPQVLIVEDTRGQQMLLTSLCRKMGIDAHNASNGQEALAMEAENQYDVFIVDLLMPVMDGYTFIENLKKISPHAVILVQSAVNSVEDIIDVMKLGVFDFITKPVNLKAFQSTMQKALEFYRLKKREEEQLRLLRNDLNIIREIQKSQMPRFESLEDFDIAQSVLSAEALSGDFLDGYTLSDSSYQVILCDIAGHGTASSYVGAEVRRMFHCLAKHSDYQVGELFAEINNSLTVEHSAYYYISTAMAIRFHNDNSMTIVSAGHPPALLYRSATNTVETVCPEGPLLGMVEDLVYEEESITLESGDSLLLYTDGITEAHNPETNEMYGEDRLAEILKENNEAKSRDIIFIILDDVYRFIDYQPQQDDMTLLCIRKK